MTTSMQVPPTKIHILDTTESLKSTTQSFIDHFNIAQNLSNKMKFEVTNELERPLNSKRKLNYLIIPPTLNSEYPSSVEKRLIGHYMSKSETTIIACCGGVLKLAHLGVLNNKSFTTHWMFKKELIDKYPHITPTLNRRIIESGNIITAGGVLSYLDIICLIIKKRYGIKLARDYNQFVQGPGIREFQIPPLEKGTDHKFLKIFEYFDKCPISDLTLKSIANAQSMSERSYQRHLKEVYGTTFREVLIKYRVAKTKMLLEESIPIKEIAYKLGFQDDVSFRRFIKKELGMPISEYRALIQAL